MNSNIWLATLIPTCDVEALVTLLWGKQVDCQVCVCLCDCVIVCVCVRVYMYFGDLCVMQRKLLDFKIINCFALEAICVDQITVRRASDCL